MKTIRNSIFFLLACIFASACKDDIDLYGPVPDGVSELSMRVDFKGFTPALDSRGAAGDAIKSIESLWVVIYDATDGSLAEARKITDFTVKDVRPTDRHDDIAPAEETTGHAEFKIRVKNGNYRIYAVANCNLEGIDLSKESDLKNIELTWQTGDVKQNAQMFGHFSQEVKEPGAATGFDASVVTVKGSTALHAWLRRAASKLTIVYDGSGLHDGVFVYIKSAQIKGIPRTCLLGAANDYRRIDRQEVLMDGDTLKYYDGDTEPGEDFNYNSGYPFRVTCGGNPVGSHSETARALYFYENIQENGVPGTITDKRQDTSGENKQVSWPGGGTPGNEAWKDARPWGTYVEIKGYYISIAEGKMSRGDITYRFMLGKDVIANYEAERNFHYQLTMKFNGYANDVDFHIAYRVPKPSLNIPPYHISYLYNHSMLLPVSISSGTHRVKKVQAEIIENHWWPSHALGTSAASAIPGEVYFNGEGIADPKNYQWHGFLSLRKTNAPTLTGSNYDPSSGDNFRYYYKNLRHRREYSDMSPGSHVADNRTSDADAGKGAPAPNSFKEDPTDMYYVDMDDTMADSIVYNLRLPMYTRAMQMIKSTGYTGNNPYVAYQREALLRVSVWFEGNDNDAAPDLVREVPVTQVRRVVNPKGIYRRAGSTEPFHVKLKYLPEEDDVYFKDLTSEGPWSAEIIGARDGIITLNGGSGTIYGKTGSAIDFNVGFTGVTGSAIIRVRYHNYSCIHLIYVRCGYDPMALLPGGVKWHATNLRTRNRECVNPMEEGSLFKYGNLDNPIDASSNVNDKTPWVNVLPGMFKDPRNKPLNISTDDYSPVSQWKLWNEFWGIGYDKSFTHESTLGVSGRIAELEDYNSLRNNEAIGHGFGVLYGDGATECADNIIDAYGYRWDLADNAARNRGMRGTFIYNEDSTSTLYSNNIFFPLGTAGYGHRRSSGHYQWDENPANPATDPATAVFAQWGGMLKYAGRNGFYPLGATKIKLRPLFYDLWRRPGAIYWLGKLKETDLEAGDGNTKYLGWDFNYFTMDYYGFGAADLQKKGSNTGTETDMSACFIRLVDN